MTGTERALTKKRIILFVIITCIIAWLIFLSIPFFGLKSGSITVVVILACAMFAPTIGNLLTRVITKEGFHNMYLRPHLKGHIRLYLLIFFGPTALLLFSSVFYFLVFPHSFDPEFSTLNQLIDPSGAGKVSANSMFIASLIQFILLGPIINLIPTLGEELGWRGYLLPKLRELFKTRTALIISGAVWGIWHAPIIAQGHNYGTEYLGFPWLGILAMVVFCLSLGIIEGYISIRLNSAIPAAMIHSAVNAGAALPNYMIKGPYNPLIGPAITGIVGGLPFIILAAVLLIKAEKLDEKKAD